VTTVPDETDAVEVGLRTLGELIGTDAARTFRDGGEPYERALRVAVVDYGYGQVWSSDVLDRRSRMLLTVGVLAAIGRTTELDTHLIVALDGGVTVEELAEVLRHIGLYAGFPAALDGTRVLRRLLGRRAAGAAT
jgi:4-carboxymuconolactone decarboxylase